MGLLSFLLSLLLFVVAIHLYRHVVVTDHAFRFVESFWLGVGVKLAAWGVARVLGAVLGPFVLAPALIAAWGVLVRFGKLSDRQAAGCVAVLVALDIVWIATGLSHVP